MDEAKKNELFDRMMSQIFAERPPKMPELPAGTEVPPVEFLELNPEELDLVQAAGESDAISQLKNHRNNKQ